MTDPTAPGAPAADELSSRARTILEQVERELAVHDQRRAADSAPPRRERSATAHRDPVAPPTAGQSPDAQLLDQVDAVLQRIARAQRQLAELDEALAGLARRLASPTPPSSPEGPDT